MIRLRNSGHLFVVGLALWPVSGSAGEYGSAAVRDAVVGNQVASAGIWCPALEATIPENLYVEMDCSETDMARSAVANDRVTNDSGLLGLLGPHERQGGTVNDSDGPGLTVTNLAPTNPTPTEPAAEDPEDGPDPDDGSDPKGPEPEEEPKDPKGDPEPDKKHKPKTDKKHKPKSDKDKKSKPKDKKDKKSKSKGGKDKSKSKH